MANDINNTLAIIDAMIKNNQGRTSKKDLARQALYKTTADSWADLPGTKEDKRKKGGPSVFSRVLDLMGRGMYTSANIAEHLSGQGQEENIFAEAMSGLTGKDKKSYGDVIDWTGAPSWIKGPLSFAADVALDPTTYVGVGAVGKTARLLGLAKKSDEVADVAEEAIGKVVEPPKLPEKLHPIRYGARPHPGRGPSPEWEGPPALEPGPIGKAEQRAKAKMGEPIQPVKPAFGKQEGVFPLPGMTLKELKDIRVPAAEATPGVIETAAKAAGKKPEQLAMITQQGDIYQRFQRTAAKVSEIDDIVETTKQLPETPAGKVRQDITDVKEGLSDAAPVNVPAGKNVKPVIDTAAKNAAEKANKFQNPTPEAVMDPNKVDRIVSERLRDIKEAGTAKTPETLQRGKIYNAPKQANAFNEALQQAKNDFAARTGYKNPGHASYRPKINADIIRYLREVENKLADAGFPPMGAISKRASSIVPLSKVLERAFLVDPQITRESVGRMLDDILNHAKNPEYAVKTKGDLGEAIKSGDFDDLVVGEFQKSIVTGQAVAESVEAAVKKVQQTDSDPAGLIAAAQAANAAAKAAKEGGGVATAVAETATRSNADEILKPVAKEDANSMKNAASSVKSGSDRPPIPDDNVSAATNAQKQQKAHTGKTQDEIQELNISNPDNQLTEWSIFSRIASWYNDKHSWGSVRKMIADNKSYLQSRSMLVTRTLNNMAKTYTPTELKDAFNALQPGAPALVDAQTIQASKQMRQLLENLVGSTRLQDDINVAAKGITVHRSAVTFDEVNKYLGKPMDGFKFGKKVIDPATGKQIEIENGWHAWQYIIPEKIGQGMDPLEVINRIDTAIQRGMLEKSYWEDMAGTFGSAKPKPGYVKMTGNNRLSGVYMPKEIVAQLPKINKFLDELQAPLWGGNNTLLRNFDEIQSGWRKLVTIAKPANHSRDFTGSTILAGFGGMRVTNPNNWRQARELLKYKRSMYNDIDPETGLIPEENIQKIFNPEAAPPKGGTDPFIKSASGHDITMDQVWTQLHRKGIFPKATTLENVGEEISDAKSLLDALPNRVRNPLGGRYMQTAARMKEAEEHLIRAAHFIDAVKRTKGKNLDEVFEKATKEVRKWHPDGSDLTLLERSTFRRVIPFYAWNRKSLPLLVEAAARRPGKVLVFPKAIYNAQLAMGVEAPSFSDPWPEDQIFPHWLRDKVGVGPFGKAGEYNTFAENLDPFTTAGNELQNPWSYGWGLMTPAIKAPIELASGVNIGIGTPYIDRSRYIDEQIPILTDINRITNKNLGAGTVEHIIGGIKGDRPEGEPSPIQGKYADEGTNWNALLNLLTASGLKSASRENYIAQAKREVGG